MKTSEKGTKNFTLAEKAAILMKAQSKRVKETLVKHELYPATYYYWKRMYDLYGASGLGHRKTNDSDKRNKLLEEENARLKMLFAAKELQIKYPGNSLKILEHVWRRQIPFGILWRRVIKEIKV